MIEALANHLWQSTLFASAAALLTLALRTNRAQVRHAVWLAASVKFLIPFAALTTLGGRFGWLSPAGLATPGLGAAAAAVSRPFSQSPLMAVHDSPVAAVVTQAASGAPVVSPVLAIVLLLIIVWCAGCAVLAGTWVVRWRRVAAAVRRGSRVQSGPELMALRRLERTTGVRTPLALVSFDASEPGVFGILRPVLLWPRAMAARLDARQIESIVTHELCHVGRRDNLWAAIHTVVQALFWFHPLVWWVGDRLVDERERACDEEVIQLGHEPVVYAESLLRTCQCSVGSPLVGVAAVTGADLRRRIEQILKNEDTRSLNGWRKLLLVAAGGVAIATPIAAGIINAPRLHAEPAAADRRGFGPPDVNRLVGFELLPGPPHFPTDDPRGSVAWNVAIDHPSGRMVFRGFTGRSLIRYAYGLADLPVLAGPRWIDAETFDISAATTAPATDEEMRAVLLRFFEERVNLVVHHETRQFPVYALVRARSTGRLGPNLRPSTAACVDEVTSPGQRPCGGDGSWTGMSFSGVTMVGLAEYLSRPGPLLNRKVVDRTGLAGRFDATLGLGFTPAAAILTRHPQTSSLLGALGVRSIFTALPEQFGLRLDEATAPADVLVIDSAQPPR